MGGKRDAAMTTRLSGGAGSGNVARPSTRTNLPSCAETMMSAASAPVAMLPAASTPIDHAFMRPPCSYRVGARQSRRERDKPSATAGLGFVFERQLNAAPIGNYLAVLDFHRSEE